MLEIFREGRRAKEGSECDKSSVDGEKRTRRIKVRMTARTRLEGSLVEHGTHDILRNIAFTTYIYSLASRIYSPIPNPLFFLQTTTFDAATFRSFSLLLTRLASAFILYNLKPQNSGLDSSHRALATVASTVLVGLWTFCPVLLDLTDSDGAPPA